MAKIVVYTKDHCPYCVRAKNFLKSKGVPFEERHLKSIEEITALKNKTGWMTLPQIFINDQLIGGFDDMAELDRKGQFDSLIK